MLEKIIITTFFKNQHKQNCSQKSALLVGGHGFSKSHENPRIIEHH